MEMETAAEREAAKAPDGLPILTGRPRTGTKATGYRPVQRERKQLCAGQAAQVQRSTGG